MRKTKRLLLTISALCTLMLGACDYDVPITAEPTRHVDSRLSGRWKPVALDHEKDTLIIRDIDDDHYVIAYDGEAYLAYHSDVAGLPLVSVRSAGRYLYFAWWLSDDGKRLTLRQVSTEVIAPREAEKGAVTKLIEMNRNDARLLKDPCEYIRN
jgi:hypothetical protein